MQAERSDAESLLLRRKLSRQLLYEMLLIGIGTN